MFKEGEKLLFVFVVLVVFSVSVEFNKNANVKRRFETRSYNINLLKIILIIIKALCMFKVVLQIKNPHSGAIL